jgi:hypothetical protein
MCVCVCVCVCVGVSMGMHLYVCMLLLESVDKEGVGPKVFRLSRGELSGGEEVQRLRDGVRR